MNQLPAYHPTYTPEPGTRLRLSADEMGSFVRCKKAPRWRWWGEQATTGVAFVFGRQPHTAFRRLLAVLAQVGWVVAQWFRATCGACEACWPAEQRQTGKAPMQRLERKHLPPAHPTQPTHA